MDEEIVKVAAACRDRAYAPYSGFKVGAAVQSAGGAIFGGCNVENISYGLTICAERAAIFAAVAAGSLDLVTLAVVTDASVPVSPCGACRQVAAEFGIKKVILCNLKGDKREVSLADLLPDAFSAKLTRE